MPQLSFYLPILFTGFSLALLSLPLIIWVCRRFGLYDQPAFRKQHRFPRPTMGGIAFIAGTLLTLCIEGTLQHLPLPILFCLLAAGLTGILDDLRDLRAVQKLALQVCLAAIVAVSGLRLHTLEGFLGISILPTFWQYLLTILGLVVVANAINLIDGVDGLAGGICLISLIVLGYLLAADGDDVYGSFAFALSGALLGFLAFNVYPSRIFMGDTGSLFLGFAIGVLGLRFLQVHPSGTLPLPHPLLLVTGIVSLPVMDALRLFCTRLRLGRSPFSADNNHLHHLLTRKGFSHRATSVLLMAFHYSIIVVACLMRQPSFSAILIQLLLLPVLGTAIIQLLPYRDRPAKTTPPAKQLT